jgi:hypothetical protein
MELRYLGFEQTSTARVYSFDSIVAGRPAVRYAISVQMALFLKHHVGIQEGPSLCARKLAAADGTETFNDHELTNEDLLAYVGERTAAEERKAAARRGAPTRRKPDPAQMTTPWRR